MVTGLVTVNGNRGPRFESGLDPGHFGIVSCRSFFASPRLLRDALRGSVQSLDYRVCQRCQQPKNHEADIHPTPSSSAECQALKNCGEEILEPLQSGTTCQDRNETAGQ